MEQDLQGKIGRFTLPEIFQLIAQSQKTGTLGIQKDDDIVMVYFKKGRIIYGYGPRQAYHIGELLRERGKITAEQLTDAVMTQSRNPSARRLGQILIEKNYISRGDLEQVVRNQVEELIYSLLAWDSGSFKFYENQYPTDEEITVDITVEKAILEGMRRLDEENRGKAIMPLSDTILMLSPQLPEKQMEMALTREEWSLLALVNGRRTAREIVRMSRIPERECLKRLGSLMTGGILQSAGEPPAETDRLAEMVDRLANLLENYLTSRSQKPTTTSPRLAVRDAIRIEPVTPKENESR
ncbi:MAG: DUF4388 domain-containing protein [Candidatus Zixiibacteriota bacterium]